MVAVRCRRPRPGDLVVLADPRLAARTLVKRVAAVAPGAVSVVGDSPGASTDSRTFGPVPSVWGRVVYRYGPRERAGRLRRGWRAPGLPCPPWTGSTSNA